MINTASTFDLPRRYLSFRYWPYEPISWRQRIARSGLPSEVQEIIRDVVVKARLLRFEKIEVVDELVAHFIDGQEAGNTHAQLIANFGDVSITASLIRKSKIRNRPIMFKMLQIFAWGMLAFASLYFSVWTYFHAGHPTPNHNYLAEFNISLNDIAEEDTAWPIYRESWIEVGFLGHDFYRKYQQFFYTELDETDSFGQKIRREIRTGDPDWKEAEQQLIQWKPLLDSFRIGSQKPRLGLVLQTDTASYAADDFAALYPDAAAALAVGLKPNEKPDTDIERLMDNSIVNILLPHSQHFRTASRLLHFDILYAIEQGDSVRVIQNLQAQFGLANHASENKTCIGSYAAIALARMGIEEIYNILKHHPEFLSTAQLSEIQSMLGRFDIRDHIGFKGERAMAHDLVQRVFTDNGNGDGRITPIGMNVLHQWSEYNQRRWAKEYPEFETVLDIAQKLSEPSVMFTSASRRENMDRYDAVLDLMEEDMQKNLWESDMHDFHELADTPRGKFLILDFIFPASNHLRNAMYLVEASNEAAITAIAAHRYHREHGDWPVSLNVMCPEYATNMPVDIVNGKPIKFKIVEDQIQVYSVWHDGDDDLGNPSTYKETYSDGSSKRVNTDLKNIRFKNEFVENDGDVIFWPPVWLDF